LIENVRIKASMKLFGKILLSACFCLIQLIPKNVEAIQWNCMYSAVKGKIQDAVAKVSNKDIPQKKEIDEKSRKFEILVNSYKKLKNAPKNEFLWVEFSRKLQEFYREYESDYGNYRHFVTLVTKKATSNEGPKVYSNKETTPMSKMLFFNNKFSSLNKEIDFWKSSNGQWKITTQEVGRYFLSKDQQISAEVKFDPKLGRIKEWNDFVLISTDSFNAKIYYFENSKIQNTFLGEIIRIDDQAIHFVDRTKDSFKVLRIENGLPVFENVATPLEGSSHQRIEKIGKSKYMIYSPNSNDSNSFYQYEVNDHGSRKFTEVFGLSRQIETFNTTKAFLRNNETEVEIYHEQEGKNQTDVLQIKPGIEVNYLIKIDNDNFLTSKEEVSSSVVYIDEKLTWHKRDKNGSLKQKKELPFLGDIQFSNSFLVGKNKSGRWIAYDFNRSGKKISLPKGTFKLNYPYLARVHEGSLYYYKISDSRKSLDLISQTQYELHKSRFKLENIDDRFHFIIPEQEPHFYFLDTLTNKFETIYSNERIVYRNFKVVEGSNHKYIWGLAETRTGISVVLLSLYLNPILPTEVFIPLQEGIGLHRNHFENSTAKWTPIGIVVGDFTIFNGLTTETTFK